MSPRRLRGGRLLIAMTAIVALAPLPLVAQRVTSPEQAFGQALGSDYFLATYTQLIDYWQTLARESDRMVLDTIGATEEGRPHLMAIITSPENHRNLERYRSISERLARAKGVSEDEARLLAAEGKTVIWIDGGLHATEVLGAQQLMELVYQMTSRSDPETLRFLDDVIILAVHANPDGHELVSTWYMREDDPLKRSTSNIPVLYEKYAGHDNNRDFFMSNLAETTNMNRVMYREWYPQIVYNHHQTGPEGTIMFAPPFRDPPNYHFDPMIITALDQVGSAMHSRMVMEGKGGTTMRSGSSYSTWWNGGLRTTPYFKNMVGLLTETVGNPTPIEIPFLPSQQLTHGDLPLPVKPTQTWHFRQSIEYSLTANRAVLDYASRNRDRLLYNIWKMGTNSIARGSQDTWTVRPKWIARAEEALPSRPGRGGARARGNAADFDRLLRRPEDRDPRGYILSADQADLPTAVKFLNTLLKNGIEVQRATAAFSAGGKRYPAGSYVVRADQAFRPHVIDMFEPQDHPNDFAYPGGPPVPPYDLTGWTLAYTMDVDFDRLVDGFDGPFEVVQEQLLAPPAGSVSGDARAGYLMSHRFKDAFTVVNRLRAAGKRVYWMEASGDGFEPGTFFIPSGGGVRPIVETAARELGVSFTGVSTRPAGAALELGRARVGLFDQYGGIMPSGWTRFILERFEFSFRQVFPQEIDAGRLDRNFDVLIFTDGAIRSGGGFGGRGPDAESIPAEYRSHLGSFSSESSLPAIRDFLERGGTVITIGSSTELASMLGLPVSDYMVKPGTNEHLAEEEYFIPGSILAVELDRSSPLTRGLDERIDVMFDASPVFKVGSAAGLKTVGRYGPQPLRSGWAWGQEHLNGGAAILEADVGRGKLFVFGPEVAFRGQTHGTFPLLFNGIWYPEGKATTLR
ncbi:MAG: M14 family metallopeptidase [Gemmatimonadota bacterium]